jgi:hypothetical protein
MNIDNMVYRDIGTSATHWQAKERLYAQLASSLRMLNSKSYLANGRCHISEGQLQIFLRLANASAPTRMPVRLHPCLNTGRCHGYTSTTVVSVSRRLDTFAFHSTSVMSESEFPLSITLVARDTTRSRHWQDPSQFPVIQSLYRGFPASHGFPTYKDRSLSRLECPAN